MKLLVTLDGSKHSRIIAPAAARLADLVPGLEIHLLMVLNPKHVHGQRQRPISEPLEVGLPIPGPAIHIPAPRMTETRGDALERAQTTAVEWLEDVAEVMGCDKITCEVEWDTRPADVIVRVADELGVDAIAMATHGRSGVSHMLAGSVTEEVTRRSPRPVLVMGPRHRPRTSRPSATDVPAPSLQLGRA